jgi:hypothetical protein
MPTSDQIFAVQQTTGFIHRGQIVYALQYDLEAPPPRSRCLIVWLTPMGDATAPWIQPSHAGKRIVTTKPGEHIRFNGELQKVTGVSIYRSLAMPPATISTWCVLTESSHTAVHAVSD